MRKPVRYSGIDVQVSVFVSVQTIARPRRRQMASIEAAALRRGSLTPARMLDSAIRRPLGDASSFTTLSRRHRAALIAAKTEAEENASAQPGCDALSR